MTPDQLHLAMIRKDFKIFLKYCFSSLHPGREILLNWHIDAIIHQLELVQEGYQTRLIINLPPRYLKSICISVAFTAWLLGHNPGLGIMNVSYSEDLAKKFMREFRIIVESAWYRKAFPEMQIAKNTETEITTTANGFRFAASVGGSLTGRGADIIIIDDPLKAGGADSDARRASCNEWFGNTLYSRLNHKKTSSLILVMQRLHQEDLTGYLQKSEEFHTLSLPAIALHDEAIPLRYGDAYHRKSGEPLHEKWENLETLGHIRKQLGSYLFSAQYQQQPVPAEGNLYKRDWIRLFEGSPGNDGVRFWSWDIANSISENADYSVGTYWHANKSGSYLLDVVRVQVEFTQLKQLILSKAKETGATTIIIEKNGIGLACCFGSLDAVASKFSSFYDLLSYEAVSVFYYRAIFQEAEGQPLRSRAFRAPLRTAESRNFLSSDKLSADLDRIMLSFFQDLSGNDDPEARRACFVSTDESTAAERNLVRISDDLRNQVRNLNVKEGQEITDAIMRVREMKRRELILLVGTKGAGKTTFIDRFFSDVLPKEVATDCVTVRIDLANCGCDANTIIKWLDEHFLEKVESATFQGKTPSYDDLVGMYFKEYQRLSEGSQYHLYNTDKQQFKIKFGEHVEKRREERPHEYIVHVLHRIVTGLQKVPCIVFDNADHFDVSFQEEVFKYAHSLYRECLCMVIVPITDTTSWQLSKEGAMQSFFTDSYYLPTPSTELILRRRIEYIEEKIQKEKPEKGKGYFLGKGIPLELGNIKAFTACLQSVFLNTEHVANWIGRLANQDIRRSLQLTREIIGSPHIEVIELLKTFIQRSEVVASPEHIQLAMIKGKYDIYPANNNSFVQNVYNLAPSTETSPLLGLRLLSFLNECWEQNKDNDSRYVNVDVIINYFQVIGIDARNTLMWLNAMLGTGLVLSYNPLVKILDIKSRIEISPSGIQHFNWGLSNWVYIECMSEVTPILDSEIVEKLGICLRSSLALQKRQAIEVFINYLLFEDSHYCNVPTHDQYKGQQIVVTLLKRQLQQIHHPQYTTVSRRYSRSIGTIASWIEEKGYGFAQPDGGKKQIFVHMKDVINPSGNALTEGVRIEYEIAITDRGERAIDILLVAA